MLRPEEPGPEPVGADRGHRARRPLGIQSGEGRVGTLDATRRVVRHGVVDEPLVGTRDQCLVGGLGRQRLLEARGRALPRAGDPEDLAEQGERRGAQVSDRRGRGALGELPRAGDVPRGEQRRRLAEHAAVEILAQAGRSEPARRLEELGRGPLRASRRRLLRRPLEHRRDLLVRLRGAQREMACALLGVGHDRGQPLVQLAASLR